MQIYKCDRKVCGKESQPTPNGSGHPHGWTLIQFRLQHSEHSGMSGMKSYILCADCKTALGLPDDRTQQDQTLADRLLEVMEDMVGEVVGNL